MLTPRGLPTVNSDEPLFLSAEQVRTLAEAMPVEMLAVVADGLGMRAWELLRRAGV